MSIDWQILIRAIAAIETGDHAAAIGDGGHAIGPLQVHQCVIDDVNRWTGYSFQLSDMANPNYASCVCEIYLSYWAKKLGHNPSAEELARIWNGGPWGPQKPQTADYGRRVAAIYDDLAKESKLNQLLAKDGPTSAADLLGIPGMKERPL